jgi:hypothetical protein
VWREKLELALHEGEQFLIERCMAKRGARAHGGDCLIHLEAKEVQGNVLLRLEVVEHRSLGDSRAARNCLCRGGVESLLLEERKRGRDDPALDDFLVARAQASFCGRGASALFLGGCRGLLGGHGRDSWAGARRQRSPAAAPTARATGRPEHR